MKTLLIDIETYSEADLNKTGVYRYASDDTFEILLFAYSLDSAPIKVVDLTQDNQIPPDVLSALTDPNVVKWAHNATFERTCLAAWSGLSMPPEQWRCSMVWAAYCGLPLSLAGASMALGLDTKKLASGHHLINYFCKPGRTGRNYPHHAPDKWTKFIQYCRRDVEVEAAIMTALDKMPLPGWLWSQWETDQHINDRGIRIDLPLVQAAIDVDTDHRNTALIRSQKLTGLKNPNSVSQLSAWLEDRGVKIDDLTKASVSAALDSCDDPDIVEVLRLRQELSRSSVKKYAAMASSAGQGDRSRGLLQFYGANRTGRWAGRLIQVQNLPRNQMRDLDEARQLLHSQELAAFETLYDISDTLSQLTRTAFIPRDGHRFVVADYSAIEARVLAWLAGETWVLQAFNRGEDLYCATASQMFGVPVEKHSELRQKGKVATLACGYGGSVGALTAMGALTTGLEAHELGPIVQAWRTANPHIVAFWWAFDDAVKHTITTGVSTHVGLFTITMRGHNLLIKLPSGRHLIYPKADLGRNKFGGTSARYMGITSGNRWGWVESYGPKFVENIVQAVSRDLLAHAIETIEAAAHHIVMHVHDEVVVEEPRDGVDVDEICRLMTQSPAWAAGLPLAADGYTCAYYQKD